MPDNTLKAGDEITVPVKVERLRLKRLERDIRPLMGSTITLPVTIGSVRLAVYVCTSAFETRLSPLEQDVAVKMLARKIADLLEGRP